MVFNTILCIIYSIVFLYSPLNFLNDYVQVTLNDSVWYRAFYLTLGDEGK